MAWSAQQSGTGLSASADTGMALVFSPEGARTAWFGSARLLRMRVAFLPDSFHEVNGVAHTSRNFAAYAQRKNLPFLCVRAGNRTPALHQDGTVTSLELPRSRASFAIEKDLSFDPLFWRHAPAINAVLRHFKPDVIHITGPSELGMFGAWFAWRHGVPLAASWHTNVHEYAARRMRWLERRAPTAVALVEAWTLGTTARFYKLARVLFAPNVELGTMLEERTGKPCYLMQRGVDTVLFNPARRQRGNHALVVLGYVGRLSIEKNVLLLVNIQRQLRAMGVSQTRFRLVGHGSEEAALRAALPDAEFLGVLKGESLAKAYAGMDLFIFPSETDTFGNVVLEALSSGVPAVVTKGGGPKFIVHDEKTGVVRAPAEFAEAIALLISQPERLAEMRLSSRTSALDCSWDAVFDRVYAAYQEELR